MRVGQKHYRVIRSGIVLEEDVGEAVSQNCPTSPFFKLSEKWFYKFETNFDPMKKEYSKRLSVLFKITENGQNWFQICMIIPVDIN